MQEKTGVQLIKRRITLSNGYIATQGLIVKKTNSAIHQTEIYPVESVLTLRTTRARFSSQ